MKPECYAPLRFVRTISSGIHSDLMRAPYSAFWPESWDPKTGRMLLLSRRPRRTLPAWARWLLAVTAFRAVFAAVTPASPGGFLPLGLGRPPRLERIIPNRAALTVHRHIAAVTLRF
jgi:hypothetical protein